MTLVSFPDAMQPDLSLLKRRLRFRHERDFGATDFCNGCLGKKLILSALGCILLNFITDYTYNLNESKLCFALKAPFHSRFCPRAQVQPQYEEKRTKIWGKTGGYHRKSQSRQKIRSINQVGDLKIKITDWSVLAKTIQFDENVCVYWAWSM